MRRTTSHTASFPFSPIGASAEETAMQMHRQQHTPNSGAAKNSAWWRKIDDDDDEQQRQLQDTV